MMLPGFRVAGTMLAARLPHGSDDAENSGFFIGIVSQVWSLPGWAQVGNSVPPLFMKVIAERIRRHLLSANDSSDRLTAASSRRLNLPFRQISLKATHGQRCQFGPLWGLCLYNAEGERPRETTEAEPNRNTRFALPQRKFSTSVRSLPASST